MPFEENVRIARKRSGLSQAEIAEKLGVTQSVIAQYELGGTVPNIKTAVRLAKLLNTTCEKLVNGKEEEE